MLVDYICRLGRRGIHSSDDHRTCRHHALSGSWLVGRNRENTSLADPATVCSGCRVGVDHSGFRLVYRHGTRGLQGYRVLVDFGAEALY